MKVVVFSPGNMNAIDGSSVWTQSVALALAGIEGVEVTLVLSHAITTERMLAPLIAHGAITVIDPIATGLTAAQPMPPETAGRVLSGLERGGARAFVVRGLETAYRLAAKRALDGKLWPYLTDIPQHIDEVDDETTHKIATIMASSPVLLCQTEELRSFVETAFPDVAGKGRVLPPAVPADIDPVVLPPPTEDGLKLCYSGKFARVWNTYEMCELPTQLSARGINATLTMVGDKVNDDLRLPGFAAEMRQRLQSSPAVEWVGGVSRARSIELMSRAHIGLSWRSPELDDSLELSTKLLEYCAAGTPPVLNRTRMHEGIFGEDYPLFVDSTTDIVDLLEMVAKRADVYERAVTRALELPADYSLAMASKRLAAILEEVVGGETQDGSSRLRWPIRRG